MDYRTNWKSCNHKKELKNWGVCCGKENMRYSRCCYISFSGFVFQMVDVLTNLSSALQLHLALSWDKIHFLVEIRKSKRLFLFHVGESFSSTFPNWKGRLKFFYTIEDVREVLFSAQIILLDLFTFAH